MTHQPITLFSWGYWGWGNTTEQLKQAVDAVERARGFAPPIFADIRIRRAVRAQGFTGNAFEKTIHSSRYTWMPDLGNQAIVDGLPGVKIHRPAAANDLLDWAIDSAQTKRRVIFFCSCEEPYVAGQPFCHRVQVGRLVTQYARQRHQAVNWIEWPGGDPQIVELKTDLVTLRNLTHGLKYLPLAHPSPLAQYAGLAWGSVVETRTPEQTVAFRSGPARWLNDQWCLPVLTAPSEAPKATQQLMSGATKWRCKNGYAEHLIESN